MKFQTELRHLHGKPMTVNTRSYQVSEQGVIVVDNEEDIQVMKQLKAWSSKLKNITPYVENPAPENKGVEQFVDDVQNNDSFYNSLLAMRSPISKKSAIRKAGYLIPDEEFEGLLVRVGLDDSARTPKGEAGKIVDLKKLREEAEAKARGEEPEEPEAIVAKGKPAPEKPLPESLRPVEKPAASTPRKKATPPPPAPEKGKGKKGKDAKKGKAAAVNTKWKVPEKGAEWPDPAVEAPRDFLERMADAYHVKYDGKTSQEDLVARLEKACFE